MTIDVLGSATEDARRPTSRDDVVGMLAEGRRLAARDVDTYTAHFVVFAFGECFVVAHLVYLDHHMVIAWVVGDADGADDEFHVQWRAHLHRVVEWPFLDVRCIGEELSDVLRQGGDLLLFRRTGACDGLLHQSRGMFSSMVQRGLFQNDR